MIRKDLLNVARRQRSPSFPNAFVFSTNTNNEFILHCIELLHKWVKTNFAFQ